MDPAAAGARRQAEQWMRVAEKLLMAKDLEGCKEFSSQALAADPRTPGAEDLHAAADVLLSAQRRRVPSGNPDPYAILGIDPSTPASRHPDVVHSSYRRLSLLLNRSHPDRPSSVSVGEAARLVADAWAFLSNSGFKSALDTALDAAAAARAPAPMQQHQPQPSPRPQQSPIEAAPQPRSSPLQSPIPAAQQPPLPRQPSPLRAAPQPPARAAAPPPLPRQSPIWAAPQPPVPPQQSSIPAARQPPPPPQHSPIPAARQPPPPPQHSPTPAARQPPPLPQQNPIPAARQPPLPRQSPIPAAPQPPPPPQQSPLPAAHQPPEPTQQSPLRAALEPPLEAAVSPVESRTPPSSTFWTVCRTCSHIHQYDRLYEARKLKCSSCHLPFVAEAMTDTPPIVPGTDMYYCTWGFFPIGFPGCPGFESLVTKQLQGPDQLNAPWLGANGGAGVQNGTPISAAVESPVVLEPAPEPLMRMRVGVPSGPEPVIPTRVEVSVAPKPVKTMRLNPVKVGAKKRGRPKGSKNKKNL